MGCNLFVSGFMYRRRRGSTHVVACFESGVLVAQLDKASDYESEDWGFKSLQGYFFIFGTWNPTAPRASLARSLEDAEYSLPGCPRGLRGQT